VNFPFPEPGFDEVVDVRSPGEFAEDHVSGAVNLPVLDDAQRAEVGRIYKQVSVFEARKRGAALVSANIGRFLETHFADKPRDYRPLVYCWRGGQRSGSLATVLADVGWPVAVLDGGYKTYRRAVLETIERVADRLKLVVLNGYTGAGKTRVLQALRDRGGQVLDLEGLARHKGSVFGGDLVHPQPAQKRFESLIFDALSRFDTEARVYVEAESAKIGRLNLPNPLWRRMKASPVLEIASPRRARAAHLTEDYRDWLGDLDRIEATIDRLKRFHSADTLEEWKVMARRGEWRDLVDRLLESHYDQRYRVGGKGHFREPSERIELPAHDPAAVDRCAVDVLRTTGEWFGPGLVAGAPA